ncbi:MAG: DUF523 domain-containing protein [Halanaerobiaceae bacterium]
MILVSACLLGENCRYDGSNSYKKELIAVLKDEKITPICPEISGGLPVPRPPSEIIGGDGRDVLVGRASVVTENGDDVTNYFKKGAECIIGDLEKYKVKFAVLKSRSPSCGVHKIYSGHFNGDKRDGSGVMAAYLDSLGIKVFTEEDIDKIKYELNK